MAFKGQTVELNMWIVLPATYLLVAILLHALAARVCPSGNRVQQFLLLGGLAGIVLIWRVAGMSGLTLPARAAAVLLYAFGGELYIFLFTFVTSSVTVALLVSPTTSPSAGAPAEMVRRRLETMHTAGLLQKSADRYALSPRGHHLVRLYRALRFFFQHRDNS